jgi:hypothetical protein
MLPDYKQRNELKFYVAGIPYNVRVCVVIALWVAGLLIQAALGWFIVGAAVIFAGTILALTRGYSNEPARAPTGNKRWENVTLAEFERIAELDHQSRDWDRAALIDATNIWGCLIGVLMVAGVLVAGTILSETSAQLASACVLDSAALFAPFWVTGIRRFYHRTELMIRVGALHNILDRLNAPGTRGVTPAPMLELQKTETGDIPQDAKVMVRLNDAPDDFIGIQVQVSLNNVQGTRYPYLYCVILAKPGFGLRKWSMQPGNPTLHAEYSKTAEVELIVVRQRTSKNSGYHTNEAAQNRIFDAALEICNRNLFSHT